MMVERGARVGVLMGGLAAEFDISMQSGKAVSGALRERGWDVVDIVVDRDLARKLVDARVDVAWVALHGRFGEDGCVQGLLEVMGVPYTGSGVRASAVAMDKIATKRALAHEPGVRLARDWVLRAGGSLPDDVALPVVVKPGVGGSTIDIGIVRDQGALAEAIVEARKYDEILLVEEYVEGDEITVAVVDGSPLPVVRILPESGFFDFAAKYTKGLTRYECPAAISNKATRLASEAAVQAFVGLGCAGLARADFIVPANQEPVFLEINTIPGMTATSLSPMAAKPLGMSFEDLVERVLHGAHCMEPEYTP
ncbi:MAG: D-alanine--D-alanine ligase [Deltaproteobacteria bacterium]|nr:D-alanine--D-alanine ligase [Deltaproteobacteria bacterium]